MIFTKTYSTQILKTNWTKFLAKKLNFLFNFIATVFIYFYRYAFSPIFGGACRFEPSCSVYAQDAYKKHTFLEASYLTLKRLLKCHPFGACGYDPVPDKSLCKCRGQNART
jgi:putative membrane protein insertion efficiency factor